MYTWNKAEIKQTILNLKYLTPKNSEEKFEIDYCISELNILLNKKTKKENNIEEENIEYEDLQKYSNIIKSIINKYDTKIKPIIKSKQVFIPKKEIINTTKEIINSISNNWYSLLTPTFNNSNILDFNKGNNNLFYYFDYINKIYISLDKQDTIEDYLNTIHEYLHALTIILNQNYLYNIECEFLSILGELITCHEMKKRKIHTLEYLKSEYKLFINIINTIKETKLRNLLINSNFSTKEKTYYLKKILKLTQSQVDDIYNIPLTYNYSTIISYFLAIELFEIYKVNKEKCIYICESIIRSNMPFENKLSNNNIILLQNDDKYIKTLKKEYVTYNQ